MAAASQAVVPVPLEADSDVDWENERRFPYFLRTVLQKTYKRKVQMSWLNVTAPPLLAKDHKLEAILAARNKGDCFD